MREERDPPRDADEPREEDSPLDRKLPPLGEETRDGALRALDRDGEIELRDGALEGVEIERPLNGARPTFEIRDREGAGFDRRDGLAGLDELRGDPTLAGDPCVRVRTVGAMRVGVLGAGMACPIGREGTACLIEREGAATETEPLRVGASRFRDERPAGSANRVVDRVEGKAGAAARTRVGVGTEETAGARRLPVFVARGA